jgi:ubiquinone/menaquinone biosynthesis C-methylase UbiE
MSIYARSKRRNSEKMSNVGFRMMALIYKLVDFFSPYINSRIRKFGIGEGMTVVDYGCGPGRYAVRIADLVGDKGKVYAVDIHDLAIEEVGKRMKKYNIKNIVPVLADGYSSTLPDSTADVICAIDMFFIIKNPTEFLGELKRIIKKDGMLVIDDGHQPRRVTKRKLLDSGLWDIVEETKDHLKCRPL